MSIARNVNFSIDDVISLLAEGRTPQEVIDISMDNGYAVKKQWVEDIYKRYKDKITEIMYANAQELIRKVPLANKFVRVRALDDTYWKIYNLVHDRLNNGDFNQTIIKAADLLTRIDRLIAEETNDIRPIQRQTNNYIQILQQLSPEKRQEFVQQAEELKRLASIDIIDIEFSPNANKEPES